MTTMKQAADAVNAIWKYKPDGILDRWSFKSPGDCENYSLLVLKEYFGSERNARSALWNKKAHIWNVTTNKGERHAILELNDKFICNRTRRWYDNIDDMYITKVNYRYHRLVIFAKLTLP